MHEEDPPPSTLDCAGHYPTNAIAVEHALVALAAGIPCWLNPRPDGSVELLVDPAHSPRLRAELIAYAAEQQAESTLPDPDLPVSHWSAAALCWLLLLTALWQSHHPHFAIEHGALHSRDLWQSGTWWQPVTALFLHADVLHLASNLFFGLLFLLPLMRVVGSGLALWSWLLTGVTGNLLAAFLRWHFTPHLPIVALGASTAVFGVLGTLVTTQMITWLRHSSPSRSMRAILLPLGAGLGLFALLGSPAADPFARNVDHLAHLTGFLTGCLLGLLITRLLPPSLRSGLPATLLTLAATIPPAIAWLALLSLQVGRF